jgi:ubiquinone/menaquinone biosynthesis C-methylase UbiE
MPVNVSLSRWRGKGFAGAARTLALMSDWDAIADTYEARFEPTTGFALDHYLRWVEPAPGRVIADVACGPGVVALACAEAGARVVALDISMPMVARLRQRAEAAGVAALVEGFVGDAAALPFDDNGCDAAVSNFGVIFCPAVDGALAELTRVTKAGGQLMISAWTTESRNGWTTLLPDDYADTLGFAVQPRPMYRWSSADELHDACERAGWSDVEVETVTAKPTVVGSAAAIGEVLETPPSQAALSALSHAQVTTLRAFLVDRARETFGDAEVALPREAWLARGRAG